MGFTSDKNSQKLGTGWGMVATKPKLLMHFMYLHNNGVGRGGLQHYLPDRILKSSPHLNHCFKWVRRPKTAEH
jgi:hypothetical protein